MHRALTAVLLIGTVGIVPALGSAGPRFIDSAGRPAGSRAGHRFSGAGADPIRVQNIDGGVADPFAAPAGVTAIVFLFTSTECPISNRYAPEVRRLATEFTRRGVLFRLIYPNPAERAPAIREHMTAFAYAGATQALRDPDHALVKFAGATVTPEAAVYAGGHIVYRGRIDDRYVDLGLERPAPTRRDLAEALAAVIAGKPVSQPTTQAVGCFIADFVR